VYAILECLAGDSRADGVQSERSKESKRTPEHYRARSY
jgi:hypothetical protein